METIFFDEYEMRGSYFYVSFWDELNLENKAYEIHFHKDQLEAWVNKNNLLVGIASYSSDKEEPVVITFEQLCNETDCNEVDYNEELSKYVFALAKEILGIEKIEKLKKDVEKLSKAYNELLEKFRVLEAEKVETPVMSLPEALFTISQNHIKNLREVEENNHSISEEDKHAKEIYQGIYKPYNTQKQA